MDGEAATVAAGTMVAGLAEPALAYDYFKSMTSLSITTLGGVLTLGGTVFGQRLAAWELGAAAVPVAVSGLLALQGKTDVMQLCQGVRPPLSTVRAAIRLVPALYGLGVGMFLAFLLLSYLAPGAAADLRRLGGGEPAAARPAPRP